ncbi:MAG: hypothetical protein ACSHWW_06580 [Nonlabens sp.]|uniref:hypothetical protein n=1 Tax=Nonlabens sp. TaxID=1888209 RepID=UPI003EF52E6F
MSKSKAIISLVFTIFFFISCKDYYNDAIHWADEIETGSMIEEVKEIQPNYLEIDWNNPQVNGNEKLFLITSIKGNHDILNMSNYLVFENDKFKGRTSHK